MEEHFTICRNSDEEIKLSVTVGSDNSSWETYENSFSACLDSDV